MVKTGFAANSHYNQDVDSSSVIRTIEAALILPFVLLVGCSHTQPLRQFELARAVQTHASQMEGRKHIPRTQNRHRNDCSGTIHAFFEQLGYRIPLSMNVNRVSGTHHLAKSGPPIKSIRNIHVGDLVYFHQTYDRNKNRRADDPYTHIALIIKISQNGNVSLLHHRSGKIYIDIMNLKRKKTIYAKGQKTINPILRSSSADFDQANLAELVGGFVRPKLETLR